MGEWNQTDAEILRACLIEAVGDDAADWETGDGWPIGRILVAAIEGRMDDTRVALAVYRLERAEAEAEANDEGNEDD